MSRHTDLHPRTAQWRLDYWQTLDRSLDAMTIVADLAGTAPPIVDLSLRNALQSAINGNIRLARVQLELMKADGASS